MIKHLACIMDGNRRWAKKQGLLSWLGHKKGFQAIKTVVDFCLEKKISYLSLYVFSVENLQRSKDEQRYLFEVLAQEALQDIPEFKRKNVRICIIGDHALFPVSVRPVCATIESETKEGTALQVTFLLCYGGQQEIVDAAKRMSLELLHNTIKSEDITVETFQRFLWTADIPSPDLVIRTGGQQRLSNFLLFQCAYSELYFLDCLWPDIGSADLERALTYYEQCQQNFGR